MGERKSAERPIVYNDPEGKWELPPVLRIIPQVRSAKLRERQTYLCEMHWEYLNWRVHYSGECFRSHNAALRDIVDAAMRKDKRFCEYMGPERLPPLR